MGGGLRSLFAICLYLVRTGFCDNVYCAACILVLSALKVEVDCDRLTDLETVKVFASFPHERKLGGVLPVGDRQACVGVETTDADYEVSLLKSVAVFCSEALHWAD